MYTYPDKNDVLTMLLIQGVSEDNYWEASERGILKTALEAVNRRGTPRILDLGCGMGRLLPVFVQPAGFPCVVAGIANPKHVEALGCSKAVFLPLLLFQKRIHHPELIRFQLPLFQDDKNSSNSDSIFYCVSSSSSR